MGNTSGLNRNIDKLYQRSAHALLIYGGTKMYLLAKDESGEQITIRKAVEKTLDMLDITEDDLSLKSAYKLYQETEKDAVKERKTQ